MDTFQFKIFKEINKKNIRSNITISPMSIYHILSLTANGSTNKTLEEMCNTLCHKDLNEVNKNNELLSSTIENLKSVELANAIFTKYEPKKTFTQMIKQYKAKIDKLKNAEQINKWCSDATHEKIKNIIDNVTSDDIMILINAIYFKGIWKNRFNKKESTIENFLNYNEESIEIEFMKKTDKYDYYENDKMQVISLNYKEDNMEAIIILPNQYVLYDKTIDAFINDLTLKDYEKMIKKMKNTKVTLHLPKFEIEYQNDLSETLKDLGMVQAFSDTADFSSMIDKCHTNIGKVIHKTYVKIDEEGTEAAAVTAVVITKSKKLFSFTPKIPVMNVNHPFLFIIRNKNLTRDYDIIFIYKIEKLDRDKTQI